MKAVSAEVLCYEPMAR